MNPKKYTARLSALVISAMVGTSVLPAWAIQPDALQTAPDIQTADGETTDPPAATPEPVSQELKISANYYTTETKGEYKIVFTVLEDVPAYTELSFKAAFTGSAVASAAFDEALLSGASKEVLRGDDYVAYKLTRETAAELSAKSRLCVLTAAADSAPTAETLSITGFTLLKPDKGIIQVTPVITLQEGPIVPELSETEQAAYDKIAALPVPAEVSFYQEDGSLTQITDLSSQLSEASKAYSALSKAEKSNVQKVLEFNGLSIGALDALSPVLSAMNNARGLIEIADVLKDMKEETALNYQFLASVFEEKKGSVSLEGLPADSAALKECQETLDTLDAADAAINKAVEAADYEARTYACEDQIKVIQGLSKHKYYSDYLTDLKAQIKTLDKDITDNYDGRNKETLLDLLEKAAEDVELIEKGADDIPAMSLKEIIYKRSNTITFTRKRTLADSQEASITVVVTDSDGKEIDSSAKVFPNDSRSITMTLMATSNYPANKKVTVTATYTLDGADFPIDSKEYKCVVVPSSSGGGIPNGGSGNGGSDSGSGSGGTVFPSDDEPEPTKKPGDEADELFGDLDSYDWAKEAIEGLYYAGIINGMEEGVFNPAGDVTREQFSKMVVQLFGVATGNTRTAFLDVDADAWYAPYITAALQAGYIQGQSNEYFGIGESIMRQDMATILYRALGDNNSKAVLNFTDTDAIAPYAQDAVAELVGLKVINGYEDGSFKPRGTATRAEAAKMIWGVYQFLNGDEA